MATTRIEQSENGLTVITCNETGESVSVADVGRCYRIYKSIGGSVNVSHNIGDWDTFVATVRRWLRNGELPILDVHC